MMTQTAQPLSTNLGYAVPKAFVDAGFEKEYHQAMELAHHTYQDISEWNADVASYGVPNGYNRRVLMRANIRSLDHLINLRSAQNAHFSVRRITQRMADDLVKTNPLIGDWIRKNQNETWKSIEDQFFSETAHQP